MSQSNPTFIESFKEFMPSGVEFLDAYIPAKTEAKSPKEVLDDACREGGMVKTGQHLQSAVQLIKLNIFSEEIDSLIQSVFEGAPDDIVGHKLRRLIARSRDRVLQDYEIQEAGQ